jgi:CHAT domain-containing protein/Tfp pilus assembly protein PilF
MAKKPGRFRLRALFTGTALLILVCLPNLSTGQSLEEAARLYKKAVQLYQQGQYQEALPIAKRCLAIVEKALGAEHPNVAASLNILALLYESLGDYARAEFMFKRVLEIYEKAYAQEHPHVVTGLNNLAELYIAFGDYLKAEPLYKRALGIHEKTYGLEHPKVATSLNNLGLLYYSLGDYSKAEPLFKRALAIWEKTLGPDHPDVATSLNNVGVVYVELGEYRKAERLHKHALTIDEKAYGRDHRNVARDLNNLAELYRELGAHQKAEPFYKRALTIHEKTYGLEHPKVATSLNNLGLLYYSLGDYSKAEPLFKRALAIWEKTLGPDHPDVALSRNNLGYFYLADGSFHNAFKIFKKQDAPNGLGAFYLARGKNRKAAVEFQRALNEAQKYELKEFIIGDHIGLGLSYEGMRDFTRAKRHFKKAIHFIEAQWQTLGLSARKAFLGGKVRASFSRLDAYEGMVRVIIKEKKPGYKEESFLYVERVKSRTLLEMLATKGVSGVGKNSREVLAKDRRFQQKKTVLRKRLSILTNLGDKAPKGEIENVEQKLSKTYQDYERFINDIKLGDSEVASLITVKATPVEKIQSLLGPSTTILEYFVTKDKIYTWLITKDHISVHELNLGKKRLLAMVNQLLLPNISNLSRKPEPVITLSTGEPRSTETDKQQRVENRKRFLEATRDFCQFIFEPIADGLHTEGLIIVPHGVLHKVPFAALNDGKKFLIDKYALSVVPSSAVLEYVAKKRKKNMGRFLAFANPKTEYVPLEFTETEVTNISGLFSNKQIYSRNEATESKIKELSNSPDIIHFACHGEFNDKQPMQSGLLLSRDEKNDGYLQVHEIFELDLRNTNLVVLSACETALSKIYGGDDLVGLSRGFIYAGTPSLLATLWEVEDHSTAILMEEFYKNWQKKGMSKPKALQQAQVSLKSMPQYRHPYFWAPFVMIGDWR